MKLYEVRAMNLTRDYAIFDCAVVYADSPEEAKQAVIDAYLWEDGTPRDPLGPELGDPHKFRVTEVPYVPGIVLLSEL